MSTPAKTPAWFVVWECTCSDVRVDQDALPAVCPGHGRGPIEKPEQLDVLVEYVDLHICRVDDSVAPECVAAGVTA